LWRAGGDPLLDAIDLRVTQVLVPDEIAVAWL
jgi:hypothetical protein